MDTARAFLWLVVAYSNQYGNDTRIDAKMCGANSLALAARFVGNVQPERILALMEASRAPFSLRDLDGAARAVGLRTAVLHWHDKREARFTCPAVLHVRVSETSTSADHFLTCFGSRGEDLCVADFPGPPAFVSREWVLRFWDGDALYLDGGDGTQIASLTRGDHFQEALFVVVGLAGAAFILLTGRKLARRNAASTEAVKSPLPETVELPAEGVP